ncbi:hypothetical protein NQ317_002665 [Molorchus minor]|uniref:Major facilitator superfamily (MFS) profile domain-containing protein n=1 Tax=Molorchus minor TaxID=1323400 RepID=A0ABQ9JKB9_9CUCU|nr:hypothetical protein NQ317_002665 [Molorchus minor]
MKAKPKKRMVGMIIRSRKSIAKDAVVTTSGIGQPSLYHALVVIFLEFFAWGLLTMPLITVLNNTFPDHTFLMNGLIMGIKGILSFLSAPLVGALSDVCGRKLFLLVTVFFTCLPIPLMTINTFWFFAMISISGVFAVTFSVVFAYVADVTDEKERSLAYGLVSGTFAASMVISPALGAYLMERWSVSLVVALATAVAILDVFFILVAVPESLSEKVRVSPISWEQADPFSSLRNVGQDPTILLLCIAVFLSYLPEAGQYSCIFVYLKLVMGWSASMVAVFVGLVGLLAVITPALSRFQAHHHVGATLRDAPTGVVRLRHDYVDDVGAGILASMSSITYPAISAFVSVHSTPDRQGVVQGIVTGMRGLCNGLGPAMFGIIFYMFHVDLNGAENGHNATHSTPPFETYTQLVPGPPFVFGAFLVICALFVASFIPSKSQVETGIPLDTHYEIELGQKVAGTLSPLIPSRSIDAAIL